MSVITRINMFLATSVLVACICVMNANAQVKITAGQTVTYFTNVNIDGAEIKGLPFGCGSNNLLANGTVIGSTSPPTQIMDCTSCHNSPPINKGPGMLDIVASGYDFPNALFMGFGGVPGKIKVIGDNSRGQLGDGTTFDNFSHHKSNQTTEGKGIAAGDRSTYVITSDNRVQSCGYNYYGQLGIGTFEDASEFTYVKRYSDGADLTNVVSVSTKATSVLFLDGTGAVYTCGLNWNGECGLGSGVDRRNRATFLMDGVKKVASGTFHNLVLKNDGTVWGFGAGSSGQLLGNDT